MSDDCWRIRVEPVDLMDEDIFLSEERRGLWVEDGDAALQPAARLIGGHRDRRPGPPGSIGHEADQLDTAKPSRHAIQSGSDMRGCDRLPKKVAHDRELFVVGGPTSDGGSFAPLLTNGCLGAVARRDRCAARRLAPIPPPFSRPMVGHRRVAIRSSSANFTAVRNRSSSSLSLSKAPGGCVHGSAATSAKLVR